MRRYLLSLHAWLLRVHPGFSFLSPKGLRQNMSALEIFLPCAIALSASLIDPAYSILYHGFGLVGYECFRTQWTPENHAVEKKR
jgi:hypothetical protein